MIRQRITAIKPGLEVAAARTDVRRVVISSFDSLGNPHYNGGGAAMVDMVASRLADQFEVTFVTAAHRGPAMTSEGVRYKRLPIGWTGPRAGQLLFHALLPFQARRIPHDLWIENFTPPFSTSFLPLFSPGRVLGLANSLSGEYMSRQYRLPFYLIERLGLRFYRDVVVLNAADGASVRRSSPSATVHVIPNGIPVPRLDERLLGQGEHILFLGRIDVWHKGIDLMLAAYSQSGASMPLLIAGTGTRREERKLKALLAATEGDVRWVGHVTGQRKQDLLERSAFVMMPSRAETFGLVALEGMVCGKPIVHFGLPTLRWMDGDVRVAPYDVDAMAIQIRNLADDERVRYELGRAGYAAAQQLGDTDKMADRYLTMVQELIDVQRADLGLDGVPSSQ
jgi:glycosyltransferase involved in cell wall biosynthesis